MKKIKNIILVLGILAAAGVAVILAQKLYNLRDQQIAPTAPGKAEAEDTAAPQCKLVFVVATPTPGPTDTPTPTPTTVPECYSECEFDQDCPENLNCEEVRGAMKCANSECPEESSCNCPEPTPTPTNTPVPTNTPTPGTGGGEPTPTTYYSEEPTPTRIELPRAGAAENTIFALLFGGITLGLGLLLAL